MDNQVKIQLTWITFVEIKFLRRARRCTSKEENEPRRFVAVKTGINIGQISLSGSQQSLPDCRFQVPKVFRLQPSLPVAMFGFMFPRIPFGYKRKQLLALAPVDSSFLNTGLHSLWPLVLLFSPNSFTPHFLYVISNLFLIYYYVFHVTCYILCSSKEDIA